MSFYSARHVKASRKARRCDDCGHMINIGEPYVASAAHYEGEFWTGQAHEDCQSWANRVMCCDEGRGLLCDSDPTDEYELDEAVLANPPPPAVYARLSPTWRAAVDRVLGGPAGDAAAQGGLL